MSDACPTCPLVLVLGKLGPLRSCFLHLVPLGSLLPGPASSQEVADLGENSVDVCGTESSWLAAADGVKLK